VPEYWFYHLEGSTVQSVLPGLLEKIRARGWQALVKCMPDDISELDEFLWTYKDGIFFPHGRDDEPQSEQQPVLLTTKSSSAEKAQCVILLDGLSLDDMTGVERCIIIINGRNADQVSSERKRWKALSDQGHSMSYFQQDERGAWVKKA